MCVSLTLLVGRGYAKTTSNTEDIQAVKRNIRELNIKYPELTLRMILLESGYLTSNLAVNYNNLLGMKVPKQRFTIAVGETDSGYAVYKSYRECLIDFKVWQTRYTKGMTKQQYIKYLNKVYAPNQNYFQKLQGISI